MVSRHSRHLHGPLVAAWVLLSAPSVVAQASDSAFTTSRQPLFSTHDAILAGAFVAGTLALLPLDRSIAVDLQDSTVQAHDFLQDIASDFRLLGSPGTVIATASLYAGGRLFHSRRVADLGLHGTEAIIAASGTSFLVKGLVGRARPYAVHDTVPGSLGFGRGFTTAKYSSFPSGHTVAAFAVAGAVTAETSRWWPGSVWYIAPVMYDGATLVGLSRLYNDQHWASDVVMAAAIGTFSGLKVVQYQHAHPRNFIDRWLLPSALIPTRAGALVIWNVP